MPVPTLNSLLVAHRSTVFLLGMVLSIFVARASLAALFTAAFAQAQNSHVLMVLPVVISLLWLESKSRHASLTPAPLQGGSLLLSSLAISAFGWRYSVDLNPSYGLSLHVFALVLAWIGLIVTCYGSSTLRQHSFALAFLFLLVPIPSTILDRLTYFLQYSSTLATHALFVIAGVPVTRDGFVLSLPTIEIEVAAQCSGIRSSMMLFLTTLVLAHLFLHSLWRQALLFVSVIAITIFKNALRIFTLSTLAVYVDPIWLDGDLHHRYGGSLFFALAICLILAVVRALRRSEQRKMLVHPKFRGDVRSSTFVPGDVSSR